MAGFAPASVRIGSVALLIALMYFWSSSAANRTGGAASGAIAMTYALWPFSTNVIGCLATVAEGQLTNAHAAQQ
jgi:hypothetical protein